MALSDYFTGFTAQAWQEAPDGFGGTQMVWADGPPFGGLFVQSSSDNVRVAEAQGVRVDGTFVTGMDAAVKEGDVVKRLADGQCFKITGMPVASPKPAESRFKRMNAAKTEAPG